jgi:hypothetical protein
VSVAPSALRQQHAPFFLALLECRSRASVPLFAVHGSVSQSNHLVNNDWIDLH